MSLESVLRSSIFLVHSIKEGTVADRFWPSPDPQSARLCMSAAKLVCGVGRNLVLRIWLKRYVTSNLTPLNVFIRCIVQSIGSKYGTHWCLKRLFGTFRHAVVSVLKWMKMICFCSNIRSVREHWETQNLWPFEVLTYTTVYFFLLLLNTGVWGVQNQKERFQKFVFKEYRFEFCLIFIKCHWL